MTDIFLSYRRRDSDYALLLYAWLTEHFGTRHVFWDREGIDAGKDFQAVLSQQLRGCRAFIALIGPEWNASEWIKQEIATALRRKILVLPVLVGDAPRPTAETLPRAIRKLAVLQTLETADLRFRARLIEALEHVITAPAARRKPAKATVHGIEDVRARRLATLLRSQSDHLQSRALELLLQGEIKPALEVLNEAFELLMALLDFHPGDIELEVRLGFLYKDLAQASQKTSPEHASRYIQSGRQIFEALVERKLERTVGASAWNGLGNMYLLSGDYNKAIECSKRAVSIMPRYAYAWADLFQAYDLAGQSGKPNLKALRRALRQIKATGKNDKLLASSIKKYEARLSFLDQQSSERNRLAP